jgi:hypothetical protein
MSFQQTGRLRVKAVTELPLKALRIVIICTLHTIIRWQLNRSRSTRVARGR